MTTIIISILCALGIGGGVMVASSSGGGGGSNSAAVSTINPGGSSGGGNSGGQIGGGSASSNVSTDYLNSHSVVTFSGNTSIKPGSILATKPSNAVLVSKVSNASMTNGKLTMQLNVFAPSLIEGTTYRTNETYNSNGSTKFMSGYNSTNPALSATFDLTSIFSSFNRVDTYKATTIPSGKTLPTLVFNYIKGTGETYLGTFENATWGFNYAFLSLGAKQLGLTNSDFGYIRWRDSFAHADLDTRRGGRMGTQTLYIFDADRQLTNYNRYYATNNIATFNGSIVGEQHEFYSCGNNNRDFIFGDISITFNFQNKSLTGSLSNMKYSHDGSSAHNINAYNLSLEGKINNVSSDAPNFTITSMGSMVPYSGNTFGEGVIVTGDTIAKDEVVGELAFTWGNGMKFVNLAFGAKKD